MRVVHMVSNYRWTERSEPATDLLVGQRACGAEAEMVCGRHVGAWQNSIQCQARNKGVEPVILDMQKHFRWRSALRDVRSLRRMLRAEPADVVHTHLPNAQVLGVMACHRLPSPPRVVHTVYDPRGPGRSVRARRISRPRTDGWVVIGSTARARLVSVYGVDPERILTAIPPVDVKRFQAPVPGDARAAWGLKPEDFVVGIVGKLVPRRRIDLVLEAVARLVPDCPDLRVLVVGRGEADAVVMQPAARLGIADRMVLAGYCRGPQLVAAYKAMDLFVYTAPGADKSCRAVREALAAGRPVVASDAGILPNLVRDGRTGRLFDPDPAHLAEILASLCRDRGGCAAMGRRARADAAERFDREKQAASMLEFYQKILAMPRAAEIAASVLG